MNQSDLAMTVLFCVLAMSPLILAIAHVLGVLL